MLRQIIVSSVAAVVLASAGVPGDAWARREAGVHKHAGATTHRVVHRRVVARRAAAPAAASDPWGGAWSREVGNCPANWYCYPMGND